MTEQLQGVETVLDGFSGTTRVSQAFAQKGYSVTSNDVSVWSEVFATCYLLANNHPKFYQEMIEHLNHLKGEEGWFTEKYGGDSTDVKKPFQIKNTMKLDAIREEIERFEITHQDKCLLLTSLILALDKVDNTLGHYAAYLSKWSARSFNDLELKLPLRIESKPTHTVVRDDIFNVVKNNRFDLAYLDPPYGSNNEKMLRAEFVTELIIICGQRLLTTISPIYLVRQTEEPTHGIIFPVLCSKSLEKMKKAILLPWML
jgi:adenine-specific DNA-methyltransferase